MLELLRDVFTSPHIIDVILGVLVIEVAVLVVATKRRGARRAVVDVGGQVAAGLFLLLAVRAALAGADPLWVGLFLCASFPAHLWDLARRARMS